MALFNLKVTNKAQITSSITLDKYKLT